MTKKQLQENAIDIAILQARQGDIQESLKGVNSRLDRIDSQQLETHSRLESYKSNNKFWALALAGFQSFLMLLATGSSGETLSNLLAFFK